MWRTAKDQPEGDGEGADLEGNREERIHAGRGLRQGREGEFGGGSASLKKLIQQDGFLLIADEEVLAVSGRELIEQGSGEIHPTMSRAR